MEIDGFKEAFIAYKSLWTGIGLADSQYQSAHAKYMASYDRSELFKHYRTEGNWSIPLEESEKWDRKEKLALEEQDRAIYRLREAREKTFSASSNIARLIADGAWDQLTPFERRHIDVASVGKGSDVTWTIIDNLEAGLHIADEGKFVRQTIKEVNLCGLKKQDLYLFFLERDGYVDSLYSPTSKADWIFSLQRIVKQSLPLILPSLLTNIPKEETIRSNAVLSYLNDVVGQSRARILDSDGVHLTLNPHLKDPYSDQEWLEGLTLQKQRCLSIANAIVGDSFPMAVTAYGPLARDNKNYPMFHPREGLQLGAFFPYKDGQQVTKVINNCQRIAKRNGLKIKPGTDHQTMFGTGLYTWHFSNPEDIEEIERKMDDPYLKSEALEYLTELWMQIVEGRPLAVTDSKIFEQAQKKIADLSERFVIPIFEKARFMYDHFEAGYPVPLEYNKL